jgi:hypothetical protein
MEGKELESEIRFFRNPQIQNFDSNLSEFWFFANFEQNQLCALIKIKKESVIVTDDTGVKWIIIDDS